ncbi:MAG TPA: hypothetical protein VF420_13895 [Casimicrobiaceae bacterium]
MSRFPVAVVLFLSGISSALAGGLGFAGTSVPTLDEFGLLGLTIVVAIAGGIAARRKKK